MNEGSPAWVHRALLGHWKLERFARSGCNEGFAFDGPVDWKRFGSGGRRVLFILKDPSTPEFCDPKYESDLGKWAVHADASLGSTWLNLALWAKAATSADGEDFDLRTTPVRPAAVEALQSIAVVNLKKSEFNASGDGNTTADALMVDAYANRDQAFLRQQIALIAPDVIIGCGVHRPLVWLLNITPEEITNLSAPGAADRQVHLVRSTGSGPLVLLTRHPGRAPVRPAGGQSIAEQIRDCLKLAAGLAAQGACLAANANTF